MLSAQDFWRYAELTSRGAYDSVHWYAIPDTLPFEQRVYQDDWISDQALALLRRAPMHTPWFLEVSHQAPHPPMDITATMQATMSGRETGWPEAYSCEARKLSPICAAAIAATQCGTGGQRPTQCQLCLKNHSNAAAIKAAVRISSNFDSTTEFSLCNAIDYVLTAVAPCCDYTLLTARV